MIPWQVTAETFEQEVLKAPSPVVLYARVAHGTPGEEEVARGLGRLMRKYGASVRFRSIDVDREPEMFGRLKVSATPTFFLLRKGRVVGAQVGHFRESLLDKLLQTMA